MFKLDCEMDLFEFDQIVGFWGGAKDRWNDMTQEEKDYLNDYIEGSDFESLTQINDFVWFESDDILEELHESDDDESTED